MCIFHHAHVISSNRRS